MRPVLSRVGVLVALLRNVEVGVYFSLLLRPDMLLARLLLVANIFDRLAETVFCCILVLVRVLLN